MLNRTKKRLKTTTSILEVIIAIVIAIGVVIGLKDFFTYFIHIYQYDPAETYEIFQRFLGYALLLIVGIELILMILYHSTNAILELILFVIARKMLIYASTMLDLVLGTLAIAIIFVVMRFLVTDSVDEFVTRRSNQFQAHDLVGQVASQTGVQLPFEDTMTLEAAIKTYAGQHNLPIAASQSYLINNGVLTITSLTLEGTIDQVTVSSLPQTKE
ncbi:hypothetical protein SAMN04487985_11815 [Aerococcus urinaehominis]|uniref:hypothetical protein n=1 Tax=Aerococcus urinaehominis TaxID=128944 RepID=UPI00088E39A6|nr:hypothetical protein [Aerococcus urinaehominis]SDM46790.1 hypothetical protein SAMN04487985_11815 [Aerococcus urinaehominis]